MASASLCGALLGPHTAPRAPRTPDLGPTSPQALDWIPFDLKKHNHPCMPSALEQSSLTLRYLGDNECITTSWAPPQSSPGRQVSFFETMTRELTDRTVWSLLRARCSGHPWKLGGNELKRILENNDPKPRADGHGAADRMFEEHVGAAEVTPRHTRVTSGPQRRTCACT